jgi:integrase
MKLTKAAVAGLTLPKDKADHFEWDDDVPGFGLRLREGGSRTWVLRYRNANRQQRTFTIGTASAISAAQAREAAVRLYARVKLGEDPSGERAEAAMKAGETMELALHQYLARKRQELRPGSYEGVERHLLKHSRPLHRRGLGTIDRRTIAALLTKIANASGPVESNNVRGTLEGFFGWVIAQGLLEGNNPVSGTVKAVINGPRTHVPTDSDVVAIYNASLPGDFGDITKLLIYTAARLSEIGLLGWNEVDLAAGVIKLPAQRAKTGVARDIFLSEPARQILRARPRNSRTLVFGTGQGGFSGWSHAKRDLDQRAGIVGWRLHDLRRYFSTTMNAEGIVPPHVVEAALGHAVGDRISRTYNLAAYGAQVRTAMDLWGQRVMRLVTGETSPAAVIDLRGGRKQGAA